MNRFIRKMLTLLLALGPVGTWLDAARAADDAPSPAMPVPRMRMTQDHGVNCVAFSPDEDVPKEAKKDSLKLKAYGEKNHLGKLTKERLKLDGTEAMRMGGLQAKLMGADFIVAEPKDKEHPKVLRVIIMRGLKSADE